MAKVATFSFYCRTKLCIIKSIQEQPLKLLTTGLVFVFTIIAALRFLISRAHSKEIQNYYLLICKVLKEQVEFKMGFLFHILGIYPLSRSDCSVIYSC